MTGTVVTVRTGGRLHIGFRNLARSRERLFGGIGLAVERPGVTVVAKAGARIACPHPRARRIARRTVDRLGVKGVTVDIEAALPPHAGYGSGTQLTLAVATAVSRAHGIDRPVREHATRFERGRRSGVGVACFERGGFVVDAGRPSADVIDDKPVQEVPDIAIREPIPSAWRFVLVRPAVDAGRSGSCERRSIRRTIEAADPDRANRIEDHLTTAVLPGIREGDIEAFGAGITGIDALTGEWFATAQGESHRPPCDRVLAEIADAPSIAGWGQSSWGPLCYGVTTRGAAADAVAACEAALDRAGIAGLVAVTTPRNRGSRVRVIDEPRGARYPT